MKNKTKVLLVVVMVGFLMFTSGTSWNQSMGMVANGVVTPLLQYQGRLTDPATGEIVADGSYSMNIQLYNVETGGTALWAETEDVPVQDGLFSTVLGDTNALSPALFNGQALWLGITVEGEELGPRQPVLPVAYALSLVPGAVVEANSGAVLEVNHSGDGEALRVGGNLNVGGSLIGGSHNHTGTLERITSLSVMCAGLDTFSTSWAKITDVGSFTKITSSSTIEITYNGRISAGTMDGTGATFELRVDNSPSGYGYARSNLRVPDAGTEGVPISITGIFTSLSAGNHTVSIWVAGMWCGGTDAYVDSGCWSSDHIVIKEFR